MSQEAVPSSQPRGLLQQMEELMAALNADLSQLDADSSSPPSARLRPRPTGPTAPDPFAPNYPAAAS